MINPGYTSITRGGKYREALDGPLTNTLLIIGTAVDGPVNEPVRVIDAGQIERLFGPAKYTNGYKNPSGVVSQKPNGATIPLAIQQALRTGAREIYVVRATGEYARNATAFSSKMDLRSTYAGSIYNDVSVTITDNTGAASGTITVTVSQPDVKGGSFSRTFVDATPISEVIDTINGAPENVCLYINPNTFSTVLNDGISTITPGTASLSGGANQTDAVGEALHGNLALYATKLTAADTGTFDMIRGKQLPFSEAVLTGLYFDDEVVVSDPSKSIGFDFVAFLEDMSLNAQPCQGTIACRPTGIVTDAEMLDYVVNSLLSTETGYYSTDRKITKAGAFLNDGYFRITAEGTVDIGGRLTVCAATDVVWSHPDVGRYIDSYHVWLAAARTTIEPERSMMHMPVTGALGYANTLTKRLANLLSAGVGANYESNISGKGAYTVLVPNQQNLRDQITRVVYDDATASFRDSYFRQTQLMQLTNAIHLDIKNTLWKYFGKSASEVMLAAMNADVKAVLEGYVETNALDGGDGEGYAVKVMHASKLDKNLGIVRVKLHIKPTSAIRAIVADLTVQKDS